MHYATQEMADNTSDGRSEVEQINVEDPMEVLYRAAWRGDAETLEELLQRDATILVNIPDDGRQTPLHISALLGHDRFTEVLLNHNHGLAVRVDSSGRTALHLASAEGHIHIVKALLQANNGLCLNRDEEGRIPLHYAAVRGRREAVQELIIASPESLCPRDQDKTTVFHMCVTYNHLETLKTLMKLDYATANITAGDPRPPIFTRPDWAGDTIFHLAIMLKRVEVVSYLLSIPEIRKVANLKNKIGSTAHNIMEQSLKDFEISELQHMLTKAKNEGFEIDQPQRKGQTFFMKILGWIGDWSKHEDEWLKEMKGNLSLVSTVIATITFQALINPPGGFIQQGLVSKENATSSNEVPNNVTSSYYLLNCTMLHDNTTYCPGQAMASSSELHVYYKKYLLFVTISFFSSLSVTLLLVSGIFPMKNKAVIWMLSIGMWISLTTLARAYITAMDIILPDYLSWGGLIWTMKDVAFYMIWMRLLGLIVFLITLRFSIRVWKKCENTIKKSLEGWGRKNGRLRFLSVLSTIPVVYVMLGIFWVHAWIFFRFVLLVSFWIFPSVSLL